MSRKLKQYWKCSQHREMRKKEQSFVDFLFVFKLQDLIQNLFLIFIMIT